MRAGAVHGACRHCDADVPDPGGLYREHGLFGDSGGVWSRRSAGDLRTNVGSDDSS